MAFEDHCIHCGHYETDHALPFDFPNVCGKFEDDGTHEDDCMREAFSGGHAYRCDGTDCQAFNERFSYGERHIIYENIPKALLRYFA